MKSKSFFSKIKLKALPNYQLFYTVLVLLFVCVIGFNYDNDFWFTINQGRYVIEHSFPTVAINSIHNIDFIYQSWGTGTLFYLVYNYLGLYGILFLLLSVCLLTFYFFYKLCFTVSNNKRSSLLMTIVFLLLYSSFITTRPHIFTVLNLVIMLYLLESYIKKNNAKYLYWLPLISLLEINMHGIYFILLLIILTPYLINSFKFKLKFLDIKSDGYRKKPLFIVFLCMLLTGFINPYGYRTIIYGFSSYQASSLFNNNVVELVAPDFHKLIHGKLIIITIITVFVLHFSKLKNKPLRYTLLLLGTGYLAFDAIKSFYLFLGCSLFPLSTLYKKNNDSNHGFSKLYHILHLSLTIIICVGSILVIKKPDDIDIKAFIDYLDNDVSNKEEIKLFTDYDDGSYAEYRGYNCYLDPRGEIFLKVNNKKEDIFEEYNNVESFEINYKDFIDKYEFDYMLVDNDSPLGYLMKYDAYKYNNVMEDEDHTLYKLEEKK